MEVNIRELLEGLEDSSVPMDDEKVVSATRIKELTRMKIEPQNRKLYSGTRRRIITFALALLLAISTRALAVVSSLGVTLSLLLFITGDHKNGSIFLLLAWLISPLGLPMIAEWLWKGLDNIRGVMWRFVFC